MKTLITLVLFLIPLSGLSAINVVPTTIRVPGDAATIQAAVDAAPDNAVILVSKGTYRETILIENKDRLTIRPRGRDKVVIDPQLGDYGFGIQDSQDVTIKNMRVKHVSNGFVAQNVVGLKLQKCRASNVSSGIQIILSEKVEITKCRISAVHYGIIGQMDQSEIRGCRVDVNGGTIGILLSGAFFTVDKNVIKNTDYGMALGLEGFAFGTNDNSIVLRNQLRGIQEAGILCDEGNENITLMENSLNGGKVGIRLFNGKFHTVARNRIQGCSEVALANHSDYLQLVENRVKNVPATGIRIELDAKETAVLGNVVKKSGACAFYVKGTANYLSHNRAKKSVGFDLIDKALVGESTYVNNKFSKIGQ